MTVSVGDRIPQATLTMMGSDGPQKVMTSDIFSDKKAVLVAVTGAFTPACSTNHLPGFVEKADSIKQKGVDSIICVSINDPFVMNAWGEAENIDGKVMMLADGEGEFTKAMGLETDMQGTGMGLRSQRYAAIIENGIIKDLAIDKAGEVEKSTANQVLEKL